MLLDISGNSFSSLGNPQDIDVQRFISAATITSSTEIQAIDTLVFNLKRNNLWDKMQVIYPVVGGNANSHKYNLKDPRDVDAAFRLAFSGTWVHSSTGMKPQTQIATNRANSFYNVASSSTLNDAHLSIYVRDVAISTVVVVGAYDGVNFFQINSSSGASTSNVIINSNLGGPSSTLGNTVGLLLGSRTASNFTGFYVNGVLSASTTNASNARPNLNLFYGCRNDSGTFNFPSNQEIAFSSIGLGLTASDVANLNRIVEAYQTTLGRQVVAATTSPVRPTQFTLPTVTYNPKQLYGNDLYVWVDTTDWRTMYNSATGNTNISSIGATPATSATDPSNHTNVRRLEDMAGNFTGSNNSRKFYPYEGSVGGTGGPNPSSQPLSDNQITGSTCLFTNNILDTNKGFFTGAVINSNFTHIVISPTATSINALAPNSAITLCSYFFFDGTGGFTGTRYGRGIGFTYFNSIVTLGFFNDYGSNNFGLCLPTTAKTYTTSQVVWSSSTFASEYTSKVIMLTAVLSGRGFDIYVNNNLITSSTLPPNVTLPLEFSTVGSGGGLGFGNYFGFVAKRIHPLPFECFIANSYTSPQQINLLYDYFRIKFKDKQSILN